ncbi:MAG TPA: UbiA family prenyltransferase [bacterium]
MNNRIKYMDYIFVMRPTLFFPVWTVFLGGYHAKTIFDPGNPWENAVAVHSALLVVIAILLSLMMGAIFIFNQITDIETDRKNNKLFFIANNIINKKNATTEGTLLAIIALGIAFIIDYKLGLIFVLIFISCGIIYSFKPFSWKDKPILGVIANFLGGWSVAACGWIAAGASNWKFVVHAIPYAVGLVAVYLLTTLPDIPGDRSAKKITFGVRYGQKVTIYCAVGFELVTVVLAFLLNDYILFLPAIAALPLFLIAAIKQNMNDILRAIKFTVLFASLAVCVKYPAYFAVIVLVFFFSKWYYRKRFDLEYPRFAA